MENNAQILKEIAVQIIGFAVVFFVLKKLAWSNLLGAIDARRGTIEKSFADIERHKKDLESLEKSYRDKLENIEQEARTKIQEAAKAGASLASDIRESARQDAQRMLERAKSDIEQEFAKAKIAMRGDIIELSGLMAEKVIREKLDAREHEKLVDKFLKDLEKVG